LKACETRLEVDELAVAAAEDCSHVNANRMQHQLLVNPYSCHVTQALANEIDAAIQHHDGRLRLNGALAPPTCLLIYMRLQASITGWQVYESLQAVMGSCEHLSRASTLSISAVRSADKTIKSVTLTDPYPLLVGLDLDQCASSRHGDRVHSGATEICELL
jgi:hypothetical protein